MTEKMKRTKEGLYDDGGRLNFFILLRPERKSDGNGTQARKGSLRILSHGSVDLMTEVEKEFRVVEMYLPPEFFGEGNEFYIDDIHRAVSLVHGALESVHDGERPGLYKLQIGKNVPHNAELTYGLRHLAAFDRRISREKVREERRHRPHFFERRPNESERLRILVESYDNPVLAKREDRYRR